MAGIYFHIPFCKQRCTYCDFHFSTRFHGYRSRMIHAMQQELEERKEVLQDEIIESIYFGGGTPSLLLKDELEQLIKGVYTHFSVSSNPEITLEANPDDLSLESLNNWHNQGINRLSIGIQSFDDTDLQWMNRAHTAKESLQCLALARNVGFENISIDLIYGLPNLGMEEWARTIQKVLDLGIPHISAYCLTIEQRTQLWQMVKEGRLIPPNDDIQSEHFLLLVDMLEKAGYHHYEISNFALKGREALHNSNYWKGKEYLGIGPSAHSFYGETRSWNVANNTAYMKFIEQKGSWYESETLSLKDKWNEKVLTGLRTSEGINLSHLFALLAPSQQFHRTIEKFRSNNWMETTKDFVFLTREGKLRADFIASELFLDN